MLVVCLIVAASALFQDSPAQLLADICTTNPCTVDGTQFTDPQEIPETVTDVTFSATEPIVFQSDLTINGTSGTTIMLSSFASSLEVKGTLTIYGEVSVYGGEYLRAAKLVLSPNSVLVAPTCQFSEITFNCENDTESCPRIVATEDVWDRETAVSVVVVNASEVEINSSATLFECKTSSCPNFKEQEWKAGEYGATTLSCDELEGGGFSQKVTFVGCLMPYYVSDIGQCEMCPDGQGPLADGASQCSACPVGSVYDSTSHLCRFCGPGTRSNGTDCEMCPKGTYQSLGSSDVCIDCPSGSTTLSGGSKSIYDCICMEGYYGPVGGPCASCPMLSKCPYNSTWPQVDDGSWLDDDRLSLPVQCIPRQACVAGRCSQGYTGKRCGSCSDGYYRLMLTCVKCNKAGVFVTVVIECLLLIGLCLVAIKEDWRRFIAVAWTTVSLLQQLSFFGMLDVDSKGTTSFSAYLSIFLLNPQCFALSCYGLSWVSAMQIALAMPFIISVVIGGIVAVYCVIPRCRGGPSTDIRVSRACGFFHLFADLFPCAWKFVFIVMLPAWFSYTMRAYVWLKSEGSDQTLKVFDLEPAIDYSDPILKQFWIAVGFEYVFLAFFTVTILSIEIIAYRCRQDGTPVNWQSFSLHAGLIKAPGIRGWLVAFWPLVLFVQGMLLTIFWNAAHSIPTLQVSIIAVIYIVSASLQFFAAPYQEHVVRLFNIFVLTVFASFVVCTYVALALIGSDPNAVVKVDIMIGIVCVLLIAYTLWNLLRKCISGRCCKKTTPNTDRTGSSQTQNGKCNSASEIFNVWRDHLDDPGKIHPFYQEAAKLYSVAEKESETYDTISLEWFMNEKSTQAINTIIRRMDGKKEDHDDKSQANSNDQAHEEHLADDHSISMGRLWIARRSKRKQQLKDEKQES